MTVEYEWLTSEQRAAVDAIVREQEEAREAVEREAGEQILGLLDRGARGSEIEAALSEPTPAAADDDTTDDEDLFARLGVPIHNDQED